MLRFRLSEEAPLSMVKRMQVLLKSVVLALVAFCASTLPGMTQQPGILGLWLTSDQVHIEIKRCPEGYCGFVAKAIRPGYTDQRNKDPNLRNRPIDGLQIMSLQPTTRSHVFEGSLYNPLDGNTYGGGVEVVDGNTIKMRGCVFFNLLCRSENWVRLR